jgi:hypothetical protein
MLAVPAVPGGVVHVIDVAETTVTLVQAEPPTVTVAPLTKFVPVIVIAVPPAVEPDVGLTEVTVGAAVLMRTLLATAPLESINQPAMTVNPSLWSMASRKASSCAPTPKFASGICVHVAPSDDVKTSPIVTRANSEPMVTSFRGKTGVCV